MPPSLPSRAALQPWLDVACLGGHAPSHGWKRTFRSNGQLFEIDQYPYTKERLIDCARASGLILKDLLEPAFDEPERGIFNRAGKPELFEQVRGIPAVLLARWTRP